MPRLAPGFAAQRERGGHHGCHCCRCGSPGFFAPEVLLTKEYDPFKVDVWGIGCVALELLMGRHWFAKHWLAHFDSLRKRDANLVKFDAGLHDVLDATQKHLLATDLPFDAADFVLAALNLSPAGRPSARTASWPTRATGWLMTPTALISALSS